MRRVSLWLCALAVLSSCSDDASIYPSVITDMADVLTDGKGRTAYMLMADGTTYALADVGLTLRANASYRMLCGYTLDGDVATLTSLATVTMLYDSTEVAKADPVTIASAWHTPRYINLHLQPKTQGGTHYYGYAVDSVRGDHAYLSLHYDQRDDPTSYTNDVYASIPCDSLPWRVITLQGKYEWEQ